LQSYSATEVALIFLQASPVCEPEIVWSAIETSLSEREIDYIRGQVILWESFDALEDIIPNKKSGKFVEISVLAPDRLLIEFPVSPIPLPNMLHQKAIA
jgi:hypothetical protein